MSTVNDFAPIRALISECLRMPGQNSRTVAAALGVAASTFGDWVRGVSAPKRRREWASIERTLRQLRDQAMTQHTDVNGIPDPDWQRLFVAYLTRTGRTLVDIAKEYQATLTRVERWRDHGEVPSDRTRAKLGVLVGHRFEDFVCARAHRAAQQQFGRELPSPLDAATTAQHMSEAIAAIRARAGTTNKGLAERCGITPPSRVENLLCTRKRPVHYSAEARADVLLRLARYVETLSKDAPDAQLDAPERGAARVSDAYALPQEATGGFVTGIASIVHGLRQAHRAGWRPSSLQREHLATIAQAVIEVGGLTPDDLQPRSPEIASTPASAIATLANMGRRS